jgi:DNA-binding NtrC family response regulator
MESEIILCVDDDLTVLTSLRTLLGKFLGPGHTIEIAESGDEALEIQRYLATQEKEISVVVSDFLMPHMRGDELLVKLHELSPKTIKIMLTGQSDFDGVKRAINGANLYRFIEKPFNNADILLSVKSAVQAYITERNWRLQVTALEQKVTTLEQHLHLFKRA